MCFEFCQKPLRTCLICTRMTSADLRACFVLILAILFLRNKKSVIGVFPASSRTFNSLKEAPLPRKTPVASASALVPQSLPPWLKGSCYTCACRNKDNTIGGDFGPAIRDMREFCRGPFRTCLPCISSKSSNLMLAHYETISHGRIEKKPLYGMG